MTIAARLRQYLEGEGVGYDAVPHPRATTSAGSAHAAHVPGAKVAKPVVVHHEDGYILRLWCSLRAGPHRHATALP